MAIKKMETDILILGAGIGGYQAYRVLAKLLREARSERTITIVDRNNYFTFVPMLHEVATGSIEPTHAAIPLRSILAGTPHQYCRASVETIDPKKKTVKTDLGVISYNYTIVALGSTTNYFKTPGAQQYSEHVRTLDGAMNLKHNFLQALETCGDKPLDLVIVGGGYTGIEVAGQYADLAKKDLQTLYPNRKLNIRVIQSGESVLPHMSAKIQKKVEKRLAKEGVIIQKNARVTKVTKDMVEINGETDIHSDITVWTAGFETLGATFLKTGVNERGRIDVTESLQMIDHPETYAIGDISNSTDPKTKISYPQLAEAAFHEGTYVARHLMKTLQGKSMKPFRFHSKGQLMPVGDWYGVAQLGKHIVLFGKIAWWIRRTVYVFFMPGFLRKLRIIIDWTLHSFGVRDVISIDVANRDKSM